MKDMTVAKSDMALLSQEELTQATFGALCQSFAMQILDRSKYEDGMYQRVALEFLEEEQPGETQPVQNVFNIDLNVVLETSFTKDTKSDLSTQVTQCKDSGADLVFLPFYYQEAAQILNLANKMGYAPKFFGCDGMDGILDVEGFDTTLAEGLALMTPFDANATDDATKSFVAKYQEKYGNVPNQFAADAYDCVYAVYQALLAAGCKGTDSAADICTAMIAQFGSMTFDGLTGKGMTWDAEGMISKAPAAVVITNGIYVPMA